MYDNFYGLLVAFYSLFYSSDGFYYVIRRTTAAFVRWMSMRAKKWVATILRLRRQSRKIYNKPNGMKCDQKLVWYRDFVFFFGSHFHSKLLSLYEISVEVDGCNFEWMYVCLCVCLCKNSKLYWRFQYDLGRGMNESINQSNGIIILLSRYFHSQNKWANFTS